ncbi:unnamed protein product [Kuraishia capsulata CBS 1993]|uniref:C2H2-type domain-containing protein n=1 Tax=Kuraishia capsulata CBS 1993 TaxID=1382522 RepID=W6MH64_9ASCO|nr:uncharacterized protein KUCA_T00001514001 [Kuraishia capsulata CBS 1993]CDK25544.1 unnamed protein product [Kuraishia capsulata CBS 1993]
MGKHNRDSDSDLDSDSNSKLQDSNYSASITCTLPPTCIKSPVHFSSQHGFELHYTSTHTNICIQCHKNFPNERFLSLHLNENHSPFFKIRQEKGEKVYECFFEECDKVCSSPQKRRLHLIDKHGYPKDFLFSVINAGIQRDQTSLLKQH